VIEYLLAVALTDTRWKGEGVPATKKVAHGPLVVRGSIVTLRRRCGKQSCRCVEGDPHETPALSYSVEGRTRMLTLSEAEVEEVKKALGRYEAARGELEARALAGIETLRSRRQRSEAGGRRR
jgi:uncharacterized protein DUF6788